MKELLIPSFTLDNNLQNVASFRVQCEQLMWRNFCLTKREPREFVVKLGFVVFCAFLVLPCWWDISEPTFENIQNMEGYLFYTCILFFLMNYLANLLVFQVERAVFLRESANKMYGLFAYSAMRFLVELPISIFLPLLWLSITYYPIGLVQDPHKFA